ncbi:hypothetical protein M758_4G188700 [Ceratodon purpureus]|nr:hypothetical protein M758_4G188700 [Ceratodon purpureus]
MTSTRSSTSTFSVTVFSPLKAAKAVVPHSLVSPSSTMLSLEGISKLLGSKSSSSSSSSSLVDKEPEVWMKAEGGEEGSLSIPEELYNEHMQSLDLFAVKALERHENDPR